MTLLYILTVICSLFIHLLSTDIPVLIAAEALIISACLYFYRRNRPVFVPALFFALNAVTSPFIFYFIRRYSIFIPQINFLAPMAIYLAVVLPYKGFREHIGWLRAGRITKKVLSLIAVLAAVSALGLIIWAEFISGGMSQYVKFIPDVSLPVLILYGLAFPCFNAVFEEFVSRAVMYDGLSNTLKSPAAVILIQAALFALWHYQGFPGGAAGVGMVFVWSVFLGSLRKISGGMLAPLIGHYFADLAIGLILLFTVVLPGS